MSVAFKVKQSPNGLNMAVCERRDISPKQDGGIIKELVKSGHGDEYPNYNDTVTLKYTAYSGETIDQQSIFDSSEANGQPYFVYNCLKGKVIRGLEQGVITMKTGERAILYIQPDYGYGRGGVPNKVPENTQIIYDVELVNIESPDISEEQDGSIIKKTLERATSFHHPNECAYINLYIKGECEGEVFLELDDVKFLLGEGSSQQFGIPDFVERLLVHCREGEYCRISMKSKCCYGSKGCEKFNIKPHQDLTFYLRIKQMEQLKDHWELTSAEKLERAEMYKEKGNLYFKRKEFKLAVKYYGQMIETLENELCMETEEDNKRKDLLLVGYLNIMQAQINTEDFTAARDNGDKALKLDPQSEKGLFRRATALFNLGSYEQAKQDVTEVLHINPKNSRAKNLMEQLKVNMKKSEESSILLAKQMMSGIGKGQRYDDGLYASGMNDIGNWDNDMAQGMMSLEEEQEAFGESSHRNGRNNHGIAHIV